MILLGHQLMVECQNYHQQINDPVVMSVHPKIMQTCTAIAVTHAKNMCATIISIKFAIHALDFFIFM